MEEIWKDVKGFESLYMVSNLGRVKNVPHYVTRKYYRPSTGDNIEDKLYIKEVLLNPKNRRKVYQYTKDGAFIKEYESVKEATKEMDLKHSSGIYLSCNHNNCYARGFKWSFNSPSL